MLRRGRCVTTFQMSACRLKNVAELMYPPETFPFTSRPPSPPGHNPKKLPVAGQRGPRALSGPSPYSAHHARGAYHPREPAAASAAAAAPMFTAATVGGPPSSSPERQGPAAAAGGGGGELGGSPARSWVGQSPGRPADLRGARGHSVPAVRKLSIW